MLRLLIYVAFANGLLTKGGSLSDETTSTSQPIRAAMLPDMSNIDPVPAELIEQLKAKCKDRKCFAQDEKAAATKNVLREQLISQQMKYEGAVDVAAIDRQFEKTLQLKQAILDKQGIGDIARTKSWEWGTVAFLGFCTISGCSTVNTAGVIITPIKRYQNSVILETIKGRYQYDGLFEGDLILNEEQLDEMLRKIDEQTSQEKAGVALFLDNPDMEKYKWNVRQTIFYAIKTYNQGSGKRSVSSKKVYFEEEEAIHSTMAHLMDKVPCIRFEYTGEQNLPLPFLLINVLDLGARCGIAQFGRQRDVGPTSISVGYEAHCENYQGNVLHQVLHALGVLHMQQRFDRNKYITVFGDRLKNGLEKDFAIANNTKEYSTYGTKYDMKSVMHSQIKDPQSMEALFEIKDPKTNSSAIGMYDRLSDQDILLLKEMYCPNPNCANEIDYKTCQILYKRGNCKMELVKKVCRRTCNLC